jgi:hypothetical protein
LLAVALASVLASTPAIAQKKATAGAFTDRGGVRHEWSVTAGHVLIWDSRPYIPVGGRYAPRYLAEGPTEENWNKDVQDLALIKARGVSDIIVDPVVSAVQIKTETWQRLVDHLEAEGFRYGIAFGSGVGTELTGTVVNPAAYRVGDLSAGAEAGWDTPDADQGWYIVADAHDGTQILGEGKAFARSGRISVTVSNRSAEGAVAVLYPHKSVRPGLEGSLPDIWGGFDVYRDRLMQVMGTVRFGPGLRFFLDPLGEKVGLPGEADYLVPDSPAWRLEFEAFLSRKYPTPTALAVGWALVDRDISDFRKAASLVPLWFRNKGVPYMLDSTTGKRLQVSGMESRFWADLRECRDQSLTYYLKSAAEVLKREIAGVPVLYTHTMHHRMFTSAAEPGGLDGLGAAAYGSGTRLLQSGASSAYSQVTDADRNLWFIATETCDPVGAGGSPGWVSRDALTRDFDWLFGAGVRGAYVRALRLPQGSPPVYANLVASPEQIEWLRDYGTRLASSTATPAGGPRTLPFPAAAAGYVPSGPIGNGAVWWVPSLAPGRALDFGSLYSGYAITMADGENVVIWSRSGSRETRLYIADPRKLRAETPEGTPVPIKADVKGRIARLTIPETPIILKTQGQDVFPIEAVEEAMRQLRALVVQAQVEKIPNQDFRYMLETVEGRYRRKDMATAYGLCQQALSGIVEVMQPYSWREVEQATVQTFTEVVPDAGASGGMYLSLNTTAAPPRDGYSFQIPFRAPADDTYTVWLACSPPSPTVSPFAWVVDTGETHLSTEGKVVGETFLSDKLGWMELGKVALKAGNHTFTLRVTDRATATGTYTFDADALLVTRMPFEPRGTSRPPAVRP